MKTSMAWTIDHDNRPRPLAPVRVELEERLEDWIERDIEIAASGVLLLGRQVMTVHGTTLDVLGIDAEGNLVVIELKRDRTLRETVAQALEYAAWASTLSFDQIRDIATSTYGTEDQFRSRFEEKFGAHLPDAVNIGQRVLLVAPQITDATGQVIEYLGSYGVPINAVSFDLYELEEHRLLIRQEIVQTHEAAPPTAHRRRSSATMEEFRQVADENGVADIMERLLALRDVLPSLERSQTTIALRATAPDGRTLAAISIEPAAGEGALRVYVNAPNLALIAACDLESSKDFANGLRDVGSLSDRGGGWTNSYRLDLGSPEAADEFAARLRQFLRQPIRMGSPSSTEVHADSA